jgi:hemoglobin
MKNTPLRAALVLTLTSLALVGTPAGAQTTAAPVPAAASPNATLAAFGGRSGLGLLASDLVARLVVEPRTAPFFDKVNQPELAAKLADQFCVVLAGPCAYKGADMKTAHDGMDIHKADFNALVEVLQQAMDARGVPFADQNRLLARLAPMHRDVISAP